MHGILPIYKTPGITSYDVIRIFKKNNPPPTGTKRWKIGHAGTLDPFAEGVLLIMLGREGTKQFGEISKLSKTYHATAQLGASSDTLDATGQINLQVNPPHYTSQELAAALRQTQPTWIGEIEQTVPSYSAAKLRGQPRYKYARAGIAIPATSKSVYISQLDLIEVSEAQIEFVARVSSGTYIRQLGADWTKSIGLESYLTKLVRTAIGEIGIAQCATLTELTTNNWQSKVIERVSP